MKLARQHFGIPLVLRPEDLASSDLDELSAITYLSYFTKIGAPGYNSTLQKIQPLVRTTTVFNFTVSIRYSHVYVMVIAEKQTGRQTYGRIDIWIKSIDHGWMARSTIDGWLN